MTEEKTTEKKKYTGRGGWHGGLRPKKEIKNGIKFQVYATREDHAKITEAAEKLGVSRSEFLVSSAIKNIKKS